MLFFSIIALFLISLVVIHIAFFFIGKILRRGWQKYIDYFYYVFSVIGVCISLIGIEGAYLTYKAGVYLNNSERLSEFNLAKTELDAYFTPIDKDCVTSQTWSIAFCEFAQRAASALSNNTEITDDIGISSFFSSQSKTNRLIEQFKEVLSQQIIENIRTYNYYAILKKYQALDRNPLDIRFVLGLMLVIFSISIKISKVTVDIFEWGR